MTLEKYAELPPGSAIPVAMLQAVETGQSLESGLLALAQQTRSVRVRVALLNLREQLEQGVPLETAIESVRQQLPRTLGTLVEAGLETGRMDCMLRFSLEQSQRWLSLRQHVWISLAYPLFLCWISMLICGAIMLLLMPQFRKIFEDFGAELPGLTTAMLFISDSMVWIGVWKWAFIAIAFPVIAACSMIWGSTRWSDRWSTSIPGIGTCFQYAGLHDMCLMLALFAEAGLPLPTSLRFASRASEDQWVARKCLLLAGDIEHGSLPSSAAVLSRLPSSLGQVLRASDSKEMFIESLRGLADIYAARSFLQSQLISSVASPFLVCFSLAFVGACITSLFLPMINLMKALS